MAQANIAPPTKPTHISLRIIRLNAANTNQNVDGDQHGLWASFLEKLPAAIGPITILKQPQELSASTFDPIEIELALPTLNTLPITIDNIIKAIQSCTNSLKHCVFIVRLAAENGFGRHTTKLWFRGNQFEKIDQSAMFSSDASAQMLRRYARQKVTAQTTRNRQIFIGQLREYMLEAFRGTQFEGSKLEIYGSIAQNLGKNSSDIDVSITLPESERLPHPLFNRKSGSTATKSTAKKALELLVDVLRAHKPEMMADTQPPPIHYRNPKFPWRVFSYYDQAIVPVINIEHEKLRVAADVSITRFETCKKTNLLRAFSLLDERFIVGLFEIKANIGSNSDENRSKHRGWMSSYAITLMYIHHLQRYGVLPILNEEIEIVNFNEWNPAHLNGQSHDLAQVVCQFCDYFVTKFDYEKLCVFVNDPKRDGSNCMNRTEFEFEYVREWRAKRGDIAPTDSREFGSVWYNNRTFYIADPIDCLDNPIRQMTASTFEKVEEVLRNYWDDLSAQLRGHFSIRDEVKENGLVPTKLFNHGFAMQPGPLHQPPQHPPHPPQIQMPQPQLSAAAGLFQSQMYMSPFVIPNAHTQAQFQAHAQAIAAAQVQAQAQAQAQAVPQQTGVAHPGLMPMMYVPFQTAPYTAYTTDYAAYTPPSYPG